MGLQPARIREARFEAPLANSLSRFTLHPSPCALHLSPFTLHPSPYALRPSHFTLHASRFTLDPGPSREHRASMGLQPARIGEARFEAQKVFIKSFCKSQFPHKFVNLFFRLVILKDKLTELTFAKRLYTHFLLVKASLEHRAGTGLQPARIGEARFEAFCRSQFPHKSLSLIVKT